MNRSIPLTAAAAGGGLLATAFLQAAIAAADTAADISDNAFTVDGLSFDPGSAGYNPLTTEVGLAPLLQIGYSSSTGVATQPLDVYDTSGTDLGIAYTKVDGLDLLGIDSAQFSVRNVGASEAVIEAALTNSDLDFSGTSLTASDLANALATGGSVGVFIGYGSGDITGNQVQLTLLGTGITLPSGITDADIATALNGIDFSDVGLPADGTVYSITNLGGGIENVYEAVPNADGTAASSITDTLVTPLGNINIPTDYDAIAKMNPGAALSGFAATSDNSAISANAFTLDGTTFDPGSDGFTAVGSKFGVAPLLNIGGGYLNIFDLHLPQAKQDLEVYNSSGTDVGSVTTGVNTQDLLGIDATQFTVTADTPAAGGSASDLPAVGTVYSVTNLGGGYENLYIATPNADDTAAASITDTLITPHGDVNIPTSFDAIAKMDAGAPFAGLGVTSDNASLSANAFSIDGTTFDPGSAGFKPVAELAGNAPLLEIGGGHPITAAPAATQDLEVYDSSGTDLGSVHTDVTTANIFGLIDTTELEVGSVDAATGLTTSQAAELPAVGTVYSVTEFGGGFENVYDAVPNAAGTAASSITDYLVTPFGNIDLSTMFDAVAKLDPGDAAAGVSTAGGGGLLGELFGDTAAGTAASSGFDLFDPSTWF